MLALCCCYCYCCRCIAFIRIRATCTAWCCLPHSVVYCLQHYSSASLAGRDCTWLACLPFLYLSPSPPPAPHSFSRQVQVHLHPNWLLTKLPIWQNCQFAVAFGVKKWAWPRLLASSTVCWLKGCLTKIESEQKRRIAVALKWQAAATTLWQVCVQVWVCVCARLTKAFKTLLNHS